MGCEGSLSCHDQGPAPEWRLAEGMGACGSQLLGTHGGGRRGQSATNLTLLLPLASPCQRGAGAAVRAAPGTKKQGAGSAGSACCCFPTERGARKTPG